VLQRLYLTLISVPCGSKCVRGPTTPITLT
jgi:hypothetical protein